MGSYHGDTLMNGGAELMLLPLHSEECRTEHSLNIPFINNTCSSWKVSSILAETVKDTVKISVKGKYKEAEINLFYLFLKDGSLDVRYEFTASEDINPRQAGLVFSVPSSGRVLSWFRKGFWSSYPEWHIGRTSGTATPFPQEAFYIKMPGVRPEGDWKFDANSLGTNDFRSTKNNIYWAALTSRGGTGIAAVSDGKQSFRSYADGKSIMFLVADYSNGGAEIFFASHLEAERRPLKAGDKFQGQVKLKVVINN